MRLAALRGCVLLAGGVAALGGGAAAASIGDVHGVNWDQVVIPGRTCGAQHPIHLHDGRAIVRSSLYWLPDEFRDARLSVHVYGWSKGVVYGDVDGDGRDEAALSVECDNGGGTADGQLRWTWVVFAGGPSDLKTLGIITSKQPRLLSIHVPVLGYPVTVWRGGITVPEAWYGRYDATCCSSGSAETIWKLTRGSLQPVRTIVFRSPSTVAPVPQLPDVRYLRDGSVVVINKRGEVRTWDRYGRRDSSSWCLSYARYRQWVRLFSSFRGAVLHANRRRVLTLLAFPFRWNHAGRTTMIHDSAEMLRRYDAIFSRSVVRDIRASLTQAPFCRSVTMAMIGSGVLWGTAESGKPLLSALNG